MSTIYSRNGTYWIQYYIEGRRFLKTLKTKNEGDAKRKQKDIDAKLQLRLLSPSSNKVTFEKGFQTFLEIKKSSLQPSSFKRYEQEIFNLVTFLDNVVCKHFNDLKPKIIADYISIRKDQKASGKTITDELLVLKATIKTLISQKHLFSSPINDWPKIRRTTSKPDTIDRYSSAEIAKIKEYFKERLEYDYIMALLYTGCRRSEIWNISRADVNFDEGTLRIQNLKTGTSTMNQFRFIEIHSELKPNLEHRCEGKRPKDTLFPKQGTGNWLIKSLFKACKRMEIPYRRLHGLRHTFISNLLLGGVSPRLVMTMAGHTNLSTTLRYSHISQDDMKGKIQKLGY